MSTHMCACMHAYVCMYVCMSAFKCRPRRAPPPAGHALKPSRALPTAPTRSGPARQTRVPAGSGAGLPCPCAPPRPSPPRPAARRGAAGPGHGLGRAGAVGGGVTEGVGTGGHRSWRRWGAGGTGLSPGAVHWALREPPRRPPQRRCPADGRGT